MGLGPWEPKMARIYTFPFFSTCCTNSVEVGLDGWNYNILGCYGAEKPSSQAG